MQPEIQQPDTDARLGGSTQVDGSASEKPICDPRLLKIHPVETNAHLVPITADNGTLGRDPSCEFVVDDQSVSRKHARIFRQGDHFYIEDLGSTNGTWVNEYKIVDHRLRSGDRIRIGSSIFKFLNADNVEAKYHESVYEMMTHDALTGAWNKQYLFGVLDREISQHMRTHQPLSLLMLDLDFFKKINDQHGHVVGDEVLVEFGRRMRASVRGSDLFARFGGEEFVVVLVNSNRQAAIDAVERYHSAIRSTPFATTVGPVPVTFSGGIAVWHHGNPITKTQLIDKADKKLYEAKCQGRNCTVV